MAKRVIVTVTIILSVFVFGTVFIKQIKINQDQLSDYFIIEHGYSSSVAGSTYTNPRARDDSTQRLGDEVDSFNLKEAETESAQLQSQIDSW